MDRSPVVLIEFNELSPTLIDRWIESDDLPNFRRLRDSSIVCVTESDEPDYPYLQPWIQWYSLHTGLPYKEHGVFRLTEGATRPYPSVWDKLLENGHRVMSFSSMNCRSFEGVGSIFLPDPWNDSQPAVPGDLEVFRSFIAKAVQEQASIRWSPGELVGVARFLVRYGLRPSTVATAISQIVSEKLSSGRTRWRRVQILDALLLDVFLHLYQRHQPAFATFFSNSTAHLQHAYWRFLEPERFSEPTSPEERQAYSGAVKFGYQSMDAMLGRIMQVTAKSDARIMFATALSQQAYVKYEGEGGRHYYRPTDVDGLLASLGIKPLEVQSVMSHQFILSFAGPEQRQEAERRLSGPTVAGKQLFDMADGDSASKLIFGAQIYSKLGPEARIQFPDGSAQSTDSFFKHFVELEATKSGGHHPDGCFWVQTGQHARREQKVSILDVAPTILQHFGVEAAHMRGTPVTRVSV